MAFIFGTPGNNILNGTGFADVILGFEGNDTLNGLAGDDFLDGGTGVDSMNGGIGNDTYIVDNTLDTANDVAILAAVIGAGARRLVTQNVRHFGSGQGVRPRTLIEGARAWLRSPRDVRGRSAATRVRVGCRLGQG